jgi:Cof subfamily protein (haloacid dehalogenase superfamily)
MTISIPTIKLLAIDIDGTLLTPQQKISTRTREAIQAAQEAGIVVTLATARRYGNSKQFADELGIAIPLITCDGALIIQHPDGEVLATNPLPAEIAQQTVEIMVRNHVQPVVHHIKGSHEETWSGEREFDNREVGNYFANYPQIKRQRHAQLCQGQPDPLRVVAFASEGAIESIILEVTSLPCSWNSLKRGNYECAELTVMHHTCSKATGVARLANHLGIGLRHVMAIGDNTNDLEMLQAVGWGVAMGQASERVKASAHAVTTSNEQDGVALAIENYALLRANTAVSNSLKRRT